MLIKIVLAIAIGIYVCLHYSIYKNVDTIVEKIREESDEGLKIFIENQIRFNGFSYLMFLILMLFI